MLQLSQLFYRLLLRLYPAAHRREYGVPMAQLFHDLCRDAYDQHGLIGLIGLWLYTLVDTVAAAFIEHRAAWKKRLNAYTPIHYTSRHILFVVLPLGIIACIFIANDYRDLAMVYLLIFITGAAAWALHRLGLIPLNPIWNIYVMGILLGVGSILLYIALSYPVVFIYNARLPFWIVGVLALIIYIIAIAITGSLMRPYTHTYRLAAGLLAFSAIVALIINPTYYGNTGYLAMFLGLYYVLMQTLMTLLTAVIGLQLARRYGHPGFIAVILGFGVRLIVLDALYSYPWINLCILLLPLAICPLWWLVARSRQSRTRGILLVWAVLVLIIAFAPSIVQLSMQFTGDETVIWIYRLLMALPYFAVMWLALRIWNFHAEKRKIESGDTLVTGQSQPVTII